MIQNKNLWLKQEAIQYTKCQLITGSDLHITMSEIVASDNLVTILPWDGQF